MITLTRIELFKLRTVRLSYGLLAAAAGLSAAFAVLGAVRSGSGAAGPLSTGAGLTAVLTTPTGIAILIAGVLGVTVTSGEFRHHTVTGTYLATPARTRVMTAKVAAAALAGAACGLVAAAVTTGIGLGFAAARGGHLALGGGTIARYGLGAVLGACLFAALGAGLGSLVRSQFGAVAGLLVWAVVAEPVIGALFTSARPYLPFVAATTLAGIRPGAAGFGGGLLASGDPLPFAAAAALVAGVTALIMAVAAGTTVPRDIT
jgi:ABC-2 type transport system permease protein